MMAQRDIHKNSHARGEDSGHELHGAIVIIAQDKDSFR